MSRPRLTAESITQRSLELAMVFSQRTVGGADVQWQQIAQAINWHRLSCRSLRIALRWYQALLSRRLTKCFALIAEQRAMLELAADDSSSDEALLDALIALSRSQVDYELGPSATPKQLLGLEVCEIPEVRARYAHLVRNGEISSTAEGLTLTRAKRRRITGYSLFAMFVAWLALVFVWMAIDGKLNLTQLMGYLVGSVVMSAVLTRGLFTELTSDERTVRDLNERLRPRPVDGKPPAK